MNHALVSLACHAYVVAALVYLVYLVRQWEALATAGRVLVGTGLVLHGVALFGLFGAQGGRPVGMAQGFSTFAFLLLAIFLVVDVRYRRPVMGAFITPLAVAVLLPGLLLDGGTPLPPYVQRPLLPVHITIALLGVAASAVAAGVAGMYLLMERQVKGKRFGLLFARLPSLEFLDTLNRQLVVVGFIALSVTLVTGAFFSSAAPGFVWSWQSKQIATLVAWVVFAALVSARSFGGWRGRRVALLTMTGFGLLLLCFLSSYDFTHVGGGWR
ncbi:inner membrane protein YpjD [Cystobacter fuscus]|uniref:Cytochrome c-type biogenesis protein CcsA/ResC n=1 Tax=Cystobacter fuscus (strain ATCC 25194 / DSM 2262 / NBRC 100088 / M29) TaxID=1242864 RepID=S9QQW5_CYSF2|nr:cytochrome c biogenesis protein CcsA [Cystobacter fuscus]EPX63669.1 Cytochrome c-type biogenesis protein CcsA/ResC [Cystobacter fuscus DSM 2262]WNG15772.1 cytochrome C biogenesis protein [Cystobacter fuscus]